MALLQVKWREECKSAKSRVTKKVKSECTFETEKKKKTLPLLKASIPHVCPDVNSPQPLRTNHYVNKGSCINNT